MKTIRFSLLIAFVGILIGGLAQPVAAKDTITIGFSGPLSGGAAQFGQNLKWGLDMAAEDINKMGGIKVDGVAHKVRVEAMDDQFQTARTVDNAKRLRYKENARFIMNPSTGGIFGLMEVNEKEDFIIGAYTTTHEVVTQGNSLIFRVPPPMMAYVTAGADVAMEKGWKRCAMMPGAYDYGKIWSSLFQNYWESIGGEIVSNTPVDFMRVTDYYSLLTRAISTKPDVILLGSSSEPDAEQIKQARELGYEGGFLIIERGKLAEMAKYLGDLEPLNKCIGIAPAPMYPYDAIQDLGKRFKEKYGEDREFTHETSLAYSNALIYLAGVQLAQTTEDVEAIMKAILDDEKMAGVNWYTEMSPYPVMGITKNGAVRGAFWEAVIEDGEYRLIEKDVPEEYYLKSYSK